MSKRSTHPAENPYKVLYWMGAGIALLLVGIVVLVLVRPKPQPAEPPALERTLLWLYESGQPAGEAALVVVAESYDDRALTIVPFPAPESARRAFAAQGPRKGADDVAAVLQRRVHHVVFLPYSVLSTLVDAAGGISVEGQTLGGTGAIAFIQAGGDQFAHRASQVLLGVTQAATARGMNIGVSQGLSLVSQVDTDLDLTSLPGVFLRWATYSNMTIASPAAFDAATLQNLLRPDSIPAASPAVSQ